MVPSRFVELHAGAARVCLAPALGGRLMSAALCDARGSQRPVLHPCPLTSTELLPWPKGGMYPLIPYSGRIAAGRLCHEGHTYALVAHPGGEPHTLHGISQQRPWVLEVLSDQSATMRYLHEPDAHWPWRFEALQHIMLAPRELSVELTLTNLATRSMPGGIGAHPYLAYAAGDEVVFRAGPVWPHDANFLPTAPASSSSQEVHVSSERLEAGDLTLFHGDWDGALELRRRDGTGLRLLADDGLRHLVLHRPMGAPYICIEPVSHVADGFNLNERGVRDTGTRILQPGDSMHARFAMLVA